MVQPDGTIGYNNVLSGPQKDSEDSARADGVRVDRFENVWVATGMGIQICDSAGRPRVGPAYPNGRVANFCFVGPNFDTIYATCGDKVYKRKVKSIGVQSWKELVQPAQPKT